MMLPLGEGADVRGAASGPGTAGLGFGAGELFGVTGGADRWAVGEEGAVPLLLRGKNTTKATSPASSSTAAATRPRLAELRGGERTWGAAGTERPAGSNRAWICAIEHRRFGSRCRHSRAMPRKGSGTVAGTS